MKTKILVPFMLFLIGCTNTDSKQTIFDEENRPSCLVEDRMTKEIIICFEGELEYVKQKCSDHKQPNNIKIKNFPKVTFSEGGSCPRNRGYSGYCVMDGGEYIPYNYIDPSLNISQTNKKMMKEMYKEDCLRFEGEWVSN